jgi:hypothetical protein
VTEINELVRKLRLQPGFRAAVVNPPRGYLERLRPLPGGVHLVSADQRDLDFVQLFARDVGELRALGPAAVRAVRREGILWVAYPKGGATAGQTDLPASPWWRRRDVLGEITGERGYVPVALVSLDETWTALRFKPGV